MKIIQIILLSLLLAVSSTGHADIIDTQPIVNFISEPFINFDFTNRDRDCLAKNIYYEASRNSEEGKVAVGLTTINRVKDGRFASTICGVVGQHTVLERIRTVTKKIKTFFGTHEESSQVLVKTNVCQFSWRCNHVQKIKASDDNWAESLRIAEELLNGGYEDLRNKYQDVLYFHAANIKPSWTREKHRVARAGGNIFYTDR